MVSIEPAQTLGRDKAAAAADKFYFAAWRWHFYTGLYVIPFFIILAVTGMAMTWIAFIDGRDGERMTVSVANAPLPVSAQAEAALAAVPGGALRQYVAPRAENLASIFRLDQEGSARLLVVDPYTAQVMDEFPRRSGWYDLMDNIHSDLLLGVTGDRMIEIAASLGMVLIATGLYLWWPRGSGWRAALMPSLGRGRLWWKPLHGAVGLWLFLFLTFFLISGLAWSGVWGEKLVQAWSQFPAEKWDNVPLSDVTHASMNDGPKDVPWALEQTPMPASGSNVGAPGIPKGSPITIDTMDALARDLGFKGRYQLNLPQSPTGVWTFSRDSMNTDSPDPTSDRTTHVDRYTGRILADIRYEDYSWAGKAMAVGIALHMGTLGLWSVLANSLVCLSVLLLCVSGLVMWWKRRPTRLMRLAAPPLPHDLPLWKGAVLVGLAVSLAFPMAGITLLALMAFDALILSRVGTLKRALS